MTSKISPISLPKRDSLNILYVCPRPIVSNYDDGNCSELIAGGLGISTGNIHTVHIARGELIPQNLDNYDGVVLGGSQHSANDDFKWIKDLHRMINELAEKDIPLLGICFGLQVISTTLGGTVGLGNKGWESGVTNIEITDVGKDSVLFTGVENGFETPTSHKEIVTKLPSEAEEIAHNDKYRNQAVRFNVGKTYGLQFHPEMTKDVISTHVRRRANVETEYGTVEERLNKIRQARLSSARRIGRNFASLIVEEYTPSKPIKKEVK